MNDRIPQLIKALNQCGYIADQGLATSLALMESLQRPLLIEGEAGVGKTAIAAALSCVNASQLIRIQCYEGIDADSVLYQWNYSQQILHIRMNEASHTSLQEAELYSDRFLIKKPLLQAIQQQQSPVLLIDEIDRADEAFEAFLLEVLSEFTVSIPELGTIQPTSIPQVILTSNDSRDLSDALRRRCLYHYADYPDFDKELAILNQAYPKFDQTLLRQATRFVQQLRKSGLRKRPGVAETLDWINALFGLNINNLENQTELIESTLTCLIKTAEDKGHISEQMLHQLVEKAVA